MILVGGGMRTKANNDDNVRMICCMICFVFIFIILIIAISWTNYETFENFGNVMGANTETMKNVLSGGMYYVSLNQNDNVVRKMNELEKHNKVALFAILAPWCGYCKQLKKSKILTKIARKMPVVVIDDKHPQVSEVMNIIQAKGFPALGIFIDGELVPYKGPREYEQIMKIMQDLQIKLKNKHKYK